MIALNRAKIIGLLFCVVLIENGYGWDRYSNETENIIGTGISATNIIRYSFILTSAQSCDFYTDEIDNSNGDTYLYIWSNSENRQIAKNDDGIVPSGNPWASRIIVTLAPGSYTVFVRAYGVFSIANCSLFRNGTKVVSSTRFGGYVFSLYGRAIGEGDRLRTRNLSANGDTYCLLLNSNGDLVGYNDDADGSLASSIMSQWGGGGNFIVGAYSPGSECVCDIGWTEDKNLEFISLCGPEQRNVNAGAAFTSSMSNGNNHNPAYTTTLEANAWQFQGSRLSNSDYGVDNADMLWIFTHGAPGFIAMRNGSGVQLTGSLSSCGGADRNENRCGDLEYMAVLSCETVKIKHSQSFNWLVDDGWKSTSSKKGLFEGLHYIVGYHSTEWSNNTAGNSDSYIAGHYASKLKTGTGIWQAWRECNEEASKEYSGWFNSFSPGMASAICLDAQKDEKLSDFRSADIILGNSNYLFRVWWYGTGDAPPN
ncbi:MAG: DVUA0089 family protein [Chitinivibrionales bacterium]|nr:DVUA0089 family protein [Chitinivibrionales bacterium]